jgi:hypothetical protein
MSKLFTPEQMEWARLINSSSLKNEFSRVKTNQLSPSFQYKNWRANIEHPDYNRVVIRRMGPEPESVKGHPNWYAVESVYEREVQCWHYRRYIKPTDFALFLKELEQTF